MMPLRQYTNMLHGVTGDLDPVRAPPHLDHLWSDFWSWSRTAGRTTGRPRRHESVIGLPSGVEGGLVRRACDARENRAHRRRGERERALEHELVERRVGQQVLLVDADLVEREPALVERA